jgi:tRNA-2-methylthio-N6-dimethylallyladenosine synthase
VMPQLHMPLQSGSDSILKAMKRSYRSEKFLGIIERVRAKIPNAAISTDIIVGFPGETEEDFLETMRVVEASRFATAYTFQYSIRPGTPAATMPNQVPKAVVQERFERLTALQDRITREENEKLVGTTVQVLVSAEKGRKGDRWAGRSEDSRLVHFDVPVDGEQPRPGDVVTVTITEASTFYLVASEPSALRRTRAGDAFDRAEAESCAVPAHGATSGATQGANGRATLGMPTLRVGSAAAVSTTTAVTTPIYSSTDDLR